MKKPTLNYHHGDLYQTLLDAAEAQLEAKGTAGISLRETAKEAGVSHAAPYRHFKSKTALLASLATVGFIRLAEAMEDTVIQAPAEPLRQLSIANHAYVDLAINHPEMLKLMFGGTIKEEDKTTELKKQSERAFNGLLTIVQNGLDKGIYQQHEPSEIALFIWSTIHGYAMLCSTQHLADIAKSKKRIHELIDMLVIFMNKGIEKN